MINKPPLFKGLNIRIPIMIPIKGRGFINQGPGLGVLACRVRGKPLKFSVFGFGFSISCYFRSPMVPLKWLSVYYNKIPM